jgi:predicted amidohydrolase YtcJ
VAISGNYSPRQQTKSNNADLLLINGNIITVDANDSIAQALAIRGGKIIAVGSNDDIRARFSKASRVIDLRGRTATPGLIDAHGHFADGGVNELYHVDLSTAANIEDVRRKVKDKVASLQPGQWVQGDGWDEGKLAEKRYVHAADLNSVSPNNPVWLTHTTGHYGVANSYAMKLAHLDAQTRTPAAGTIDRGENGTPTGVLKESAMELVTRLIPPVTAEQERNGILHIMQALHSEGMTAVKDADVQQHTWDAYEQLLEEGKLALHVFVLWHAGSNMQSAQQALTRINTLPKPPQSFGEGKLLSGGAKLYMDGSGGGRTAWVYKEWNKNFKDTDSGNYGYPAMDPGVYRQVVRLFHEAGVHVGTHAVGDRAIDWVVDSYAEALRAKPIKGLRHSIIHCNIPTEHALDTMAQLEKDHDAGYPEPQPPFTWWIGDTYAGNFGPERSPRLNPFKTYVAKNIRWAAGSDFFVTPFPARYGLWSSIVREPLKGIYGTHPFGTAESVDAHTALRSYTAWAARQLFLENQIGSIELGKDADISLWDRDLYASSPAALKDLKCVMTLFHGEVVYKARDMQ